MLGEDWLKLSQSELYEAFDDWIREAANTDNWSENNPNGQRIHWKSLSTVWERYKSWQSSITLQCRPSNDELMQHGMGQMLNSPGCYLFGWGSGYDTVAPRYIGKTGKSRSKRENTLVRRLRNRYIPTKRFNLHPEDSKIKQCAIATWLTINGLANVDGGWKQLPDIFDSLILRHYKNFGPSKNEVRLRIKNNQSANEIVKYAKTHYKPPLAVRHGEDYAKFGIDEIWFAIFPVSNKATARKLETILIPAVRCWNRERGLKPILNKQG